MNVKARNYTAVAVALLVATIFFVLQPSGSFKKEIGNANKLGVNSVSTDSVSSSILISNVDIRDRFVKIDSIWTDIPGFLSVKKTSSAGTSRIIGASPYLLSGENRDVTIILSDKILDGEVAIYSFYKDNGDQSFSSVADDLVVEDKEAQALVQIKSY